MKRFLRFRPSSRPTLIAAALLTIVAVIGTPSKAAPPANPAPNQTVIAHTYSALPLSFEANQGQTDPTVKYLSRGAGFSAFFKQNETDLLLSRQTPQSSANVRIKSASEPIVDSLLRMHLLDAREDAPITGDEQLPGTVNYLRGNEPANWHTGIPTFERVKYSGVYAGTNLVYYGSNGRLEFDFQLAPGADPSAIHMRFDGANRLRLDYDGNLVVVTASGSVEFHKPEIYQLAADGTRSSIRGEFTISKRDTVGFRIAHYDRSRPLVIDPILSYSTYFSDPSGASALAVDAAGEVFITGSASSNFPATPGSFQTTPTSQAYGALGPYVAKLNSSGTALIYCTFLSGSGSDATFAIALNASGDAFVTGETNSKDFPVTPGAFQTVLKTTGSSGSGFVSVLNNSGTELVYSTFLGGSSGSFANGIAVDSSGNAYVAGQTVDTDFPVTPGAFETTISKSGADPSAGYVTKLNPAGSALVYSTYLAGSGRDQVYGIAVDSTGSALVGGFTDSTDFPTTQGAFDTTNPAPGTGAGFVTRLKPDGSGLAWSSYLGGTFASYVTAVAVDSSGSAYAVGNTSSFDFPVSAGAFQPNQHGNSNGFVTKFNQDGSLLAYSTLLGGAAPFGDTVAAIAVDSQGNAVVTGPASSLDFPVTQGAFQPQNLAMLVSSDDGSFVTKINSTGTALIYSTYLSGSGDQSGETCDCTSGIGLDPAGNVYVAGLTVSADFPTTPGAFQPATTNVAGEDLFVTKFNAAEMTTLPAVSVAITSSVNPQEFGQPITFTAKVTPTSGATPTGIVAFSIEQQELSDCDGFCFGLGPWIFMPLNAAGAASYSPTWNLWSGSPEVAVYYLGDQNNAPGSGSMTQTVTQIPTTTTLTASPATITWGQSVTFTAQTLDNNGKPVPGSANFQIGSTGEAGVILDSTGKGAWTLAQGGEGYSLLEVGPNTIESMYENFSTGSPYATSSATVTVTVNPVGVVPTPTLSVPAGTYTWYQSVYVSDSNPSASIYYTTDGTTPVAGSSQILLPGYYIFVGSTETVQVIASLQGYSTSPVASAAYTINIPPPSFSLTLVPASLMVFAGQSSSTIVDINEENGFGQTVILSCSGLPEGVTYSFTSPVNVNGGAQSRLTLSASNTAANSTIRTGPSLVRTFVFAVVLGAWGLFKRRRRWFILAIILVCVTANMCVGCGNGGPPPPPTPTTSNVTVTGTSGSLTETATLSLTLN